MPRSSRTFGFLTAVEEAAKVLDRAHMEARSVQNGVALVKLMGRHAGFIAAFATIASQDVNFTLIPEVAFALDGERGLLALLERRVRERQHALVVVAEGAGQDLLLQRRGTLRADAAHACLTNPDEAVEFVKSTGCDSLAAAIGTSHGAYKFTGSQSLHFDVIEQIRRRLPGTPIVMHGSSSVAADEVRRINAAGGALDPGAPGGRRRRLLAGGGARGHKGQHRHGWASRVDPRPP